jgi:hypothetical protein
MPQDPILAVNEWIDFEEIAAESIVLTSSQIEQAMQLARSSTNRSRTNHLQSWSIYLQTLAHLGFEQWLQGRARDVTLHSTPLNAVAANDGWASLQINGFKLCLLATASQPDETIAISRQVIVAAETAAHFYVMVAIAEELAQVTIHSFLRHDRLVAQLPTLTCDANETYAVPSQWFDSDLDHLLLYLRCTESSMFSLDLPTEFSSVTLATSQPIPTQSTLNVSMWLQGRLDDLAQQLSWVLLPPLTWQPAFRLGIPNQDNPVTDDFEAIVTQLERQGMRLPSGARAACHQLVLSNYPMRLFVLVGERSHHPPEWSLLVILGPTPGNHLPEGTQLQLSDATSILVEQTRRSDTEAEYLFVQVTGSWDEVFQVSILSPIAEKITLPAFTFRPVEENR